MALVREFERGECGAQKLVAEEQPLLPLEARWGLDTGSLARDGHGAARGGSEERFGPFFPPPAGFGLQIAEDATDDAEDGGLAASCGLAGEAYEGPHGGRQGCGRRGVGGGGPPIPSPAFTLPVGQAQGKRLATRRGGGVWPA